MTPHRSRRITLAAVALALAALVVRPEVAANLVARGDEMTEAGDALRAQVYYRRALAIDASSEIALDRMAVIASLNGNARERDEAARRLRDAISKRSSSALLFDLALLELRSHRYAAAASAFRRLHEAAPRVFFAAALRVASRRAKEDHT